MRHSLMIGLLPILMVFGCALDGMDKHDVARDCDGECSSSCPCEVNEGDCDRNSDCSPGLYCKQQSGKDYCRDCKGRCSSDCPCDLGKGDCDTDSDCLPGLSCPPDGAGAEQCTADGDVGGCSQRCSSTCPCAVGEGDCDSASDCLPGLICPQQSGTDFCAEEDEEEPPSSGDITHVNTTEAYDSNGQGLRISRPSGVRNGDLLVLILHRTDDDLPLFVNGWTRVAECFKGGNGNDCGVEADCTSWHNSNYCARFSGNGTGHDLAQSVFYKVAGSNEPSSYQFNLNRDSSGHPGWAIMTALRGANTNNPVRDWSHEGCDGDPDSKFPSVYGQRGDMVLLSQSFDDAVAQSKFGAPSGTRLLGYKSQSDEAGFLFGGILTSSGETGTMETRGDGAPSCKDALVSLTIRPR